MVIKQFREDKEADLCRINPYKKRSWTKNVYDGEKTAYFGRTPKRWGQLLLFYIVFWSAIAVLCAICYIVFEKTLSPEQPRWFAHQPTFSVAPCDDVNAQYCRLTIDSDFSSYIRKTKVFLSKYGHLPDERNFGTCTRANKYGFEEKSPCLFLKINQLIGYVPQTYELSSELPQSAPSELKNFINSLKDSDKKDRIWISCASQNKDAKLTYFPNIRSVNASLLRLDKIPIKGDNQFYDETDFGRIVAIKLRYIPPDVDIKVHCYLWAKNIRIVDEENHGAGKVLIKLKILS